MWKLMENSTTPIRRYGKLVLIATAIAIVADLIGTVKINIGIGDLVIFPLVIATIIGGILGPDILKLLKESECRDAGDLVLVVIAPFMARMGISAGGNLSKLVDVGPALILQEFGNLATVTLSLPLAIMLGLGLESIGATYSINRDGNLALSTDYWGPDAPETRGTFSVYIVGSIIGTVFIGILVSLVASLDVFHPLALGMACGVGSGSMMAAGAATLGEIYPQYAEEILLYASTSDVLSGIDGVYMGTFIGVPMTTWLYKKLSPVLAPKTKKAKEEQK